MARFRIVKMNKQGEKYPYSVERKFCGIWWPVLGANYCEEYEAKSDIEDYLSKKGRWAITPRKSIMREISSEDILIDKLKGN